MALLTISDLENTPPEQLAEYLKHAQLLHQIWHAWKKQHDGNTVLTVEFRGERDRKKGVHASELSHCMRQLFYAVRGAPRVVLAKDKNVNFQRRFDIGTMVHAYIQNEFHEMCAWYNNVQSSVYLTFRDEVRIDASLGGAAAEYEAESSCDGCFVFHTLGTGEDGNPAWLAFLRVGLEIKTSADGEFNKLKEPQQAHQEQTCFYMKMLDLPYMWVLYFNKNNQKYTTSDPPFLFRYNRLLWDSKLQPRIENARQMARDNQVPARSEGMHCGWCAFAHECQPEYLKPNRRGGPAPSPNEF